MIQFDDMEIDLRRDTATFSDGLTLNSYELCSAWAAYERMCTANCLIDNYEVEEDSAWEIACEIRDRMNNTDTTESQLIEYYAEKYELEERE